MSVQFPEKHREDLILCLKRVEGQLRRLRKMIESGGGWEKVGEQMAASRKALDRALYLMIGCMLEQHAGKNP